MSYQQNPYYSPPPPPRRPEEVEYAEYEYEEDAYYDDEATEDTLFQRLLIFVSGGCLVFICMGCCILTFMGLWILDPGAGLVASTPIPGSDVGLTYEEPAFPDEVVVNDENVELQILGVNRNVAIPGTPPVEGREIVVVTIALTNLGQEEVSYNESDFILINAFEEAYTVSPASASVDGALGRGKLGPNEGLEGRLVFDLLAGETNLVLGWEGGRETSPRYIYIE